MFQLYKIVLGLPKALSVGEWKIEMMIAIRRFHHVTLLSTKHPDVVLFISLKPSMNATFR